MTAFLLASAPLFLIAFYSLFAKKPAAAILIACLKGLLGCLPSFAALLIFAEGFPLSYRPFPHYLYHLVRDLLVHMAVMVAGYYLANRPRAEDDRTDVWVGFVSFGLGYLTLANFSDFVVLYPLYDVYILFLLPAYRICLVVICAALAAQLHAARGRLARLLPATVMLLAPCAAGFGAYLARAKLSSLSIAFACVFAAVAGMTVLLMVRAPSFRFPELAIDIDLRRLFRSRRSTE